MTVDTSTEAVTKLLDGVTPGPWDHEWEIDGPKTHTRIKAGAAIATTAQQCGRPHHRNAASSNARFIAAARDLVPALLAERDALRRENENLRAITEGNA